MACTYYSLRESYFMSEFVRML